MSLSFTSKTGYYGLRVNPTFEEVIGTIRTPLRIPLPDRKAKWYANSPYRALILDAEEKYQNYERQAIDYRLAGADAPESAARVHGSDAGQDPTFATIDAHHRKMEEHEAIDTAHRLLHEEESRKTAANRREILSQSHAPNKTNPVIEAEHDELDVAGVEHYMPMPRSLAPKAHFTKPLPQFAAGGHPQAPEFKSFEQLNMGVPDNFLAATMSRSQAMTYERLRDLVEHTFST